MSTAPAPHAVVGSALERTHRPAEDRQQPKADPAARPCNICRRAGRAAEEAWVRSNIRPFKDEKFALWRCASCRSIHARDPVDLDHYYAKYPFHGATLDWRLRVMYKNLLARLTRTGLRPEHKILDYGCGGGLFVEYLRERGFDAVGYDQYSEDFSSPAVLARRYDVVLSQDVIEHVDEPEALLEKFSSLVTPGGLIALGTPDAAAIELSRPESFVHALHQPFHRHILSKAALVGMAEARGWRLLRFFDTMYNNTLVPFINPRFAHFYLRCFDDCLDLGFEPVRLSLRLFSPIAFFWAFFGFFFAPRTDVMAVFRHP